MPKFVLSAIACILLMLVLAPRTHINSFEWRGEWLLKSRGGRGGGGCFGYLVELSSGIM